MTEKEGTVKLEIKDVKKLQAMTVSGGGGGPRGPSSFSTTPGELRCVCQCGRETLINRDTLEDALGLNKPASGLVNLALEGVILESPSPGDLIFLTDNTNGHNYPLATLLLFGSNNKESSALYFFNGGIRVGNNLPLPRVFRPTKIHIDLIPDSRLMEKIVEVSGVEVFGEAMKKPVARKSSRNSKTKML